MKNVNLVDSFNNAINGIIHAFKTEKNMKIHVLTAVMVLIFSLFTTINRYEFMILCFTIALVIVAEMLNTAIESLVDISTEQYHPLAEKAKDVAAGAVFIATINALIVGYMIFFDKISLIDNVFQKVHRTPNHIMFIAVTAVLIMVLILKSHFNKGTPFHGGMPSGHAALAFSTATAISFLSGDAAIIMLCMILALLVAQSRIEGHIHSILEVVAGGILGIIVTIIVFQLIG